MNPEWVMNLRDRCAAAGVAFFFKQWGGVRKARAGRLLEGRTYDETPPRVMHPMPERKERLALAAAYLAGAGSGGSAMGGGRGGASFGNSGGHIAPITTTGG